MKTSLGLLISWFLRQDKYIAQILGSTSLNLFFFFRKREVSSVVQYNVCYMCKVIEDENNNASATVCRALMLNLGQSLIYQQQNVFTQTACQFNWLDLYVGVIRYCTINHSLSIC